MVFACIMGKVEIAERAALANTVENGALLAAVGELQGGVRAPERALLAAQLPVHPGRLASLELGGLGAEEAPDHVLAHGGEGAHCVRLGQGDLELSVGRDRARRRGVHRTPGLGIAQSQLEADVGVREHLANVRSRGEDGGAHRSGRCGRRDSHRGVLRLTTELYAHRHRRGHYGTPAHPSVVAVDSGE